MKRVTLEVVEGPDRGRRFTFDARDRFLLGRAPTAHLQITQDPFFSRHHAMIEVDPPNVMVQDLKSTNGSWVNGKKITGAVNLGSGDSIGGGKTRIVITVEADAVAAAPAAAAAGAGIAATLAATSAPPHAPAHAPMPPTLASSIPPPAPPGRGTVSALPPPPSGPVASGPLVPVRCTRCGSLAPNERPRGQDEDMVFFCDACQQQMLASPPLVDGYRTDALLGRGGMGAVYRATHPVLGARAIKMILPRAAMSQRVRAMFVREATSQAMLDHPRVVRVLDFRETAPGIFCMVMELVEGPSAEALVKDRPTGIDPRLAVNIVAQALEGLGHAHSRGIVHRDIKDANIMLGRDAAGALAVKLTDFGLAKSYEMSGASGFTRSGDISGTVPYMAPEQILDFRNVKPPADLYSMGATLYHLLTGQLAYAFRPDADPLVQILEEEIIDPRQRNPAIPAALAQAIAIAMRKAPAERYRDANTMRQALLAAVT